MYVTNYQHLRGKPDVKIPIRIDPERLALITKSSYASSDTWDKSYFSFHMIGNVKRREFLDYLFPKGIGGEASDFRVDLKIRIGAKPEIIYFFHVNVKYKMIVDGSHLVNDEMKLFRGIVHGSRQEIIDLCKPIIKKYGHLMGKKSKDDFLNLYCAEDVSYMIGKLSTAQKKEVAAMLQDRYFPV